MSTLYRFARLYTDIGYVQIKHSSLWRLTDFYETSDGVLELYCEESTEPVALQPLFQSGTPEAIKKTFLSTNRCISVIAWNSKLLAWALEGFDVKLGEKTFAKPMPTKRFEMPQEGQDEPDPDCWHTVLLFIPKNGGEALVADPSHHQYSWETGIDKLSDFLRTKVERTTGDLDLDFGSALEWQPQLDKDRITTTLSTVVAKTTCNVVVEEIESIGGLDNFLGMEETAYEAARARILDSLDRKLHDRRTELETIMYDEQTLSYPVDLEMLEAECDGPGHDLCSAAYERIMAHGF